MHTAKRDSWSQLKEQGGLFTLRLTLLLYRYGGSRLCQWIMYVVILWYWLFAKKARQASLQYLRYLHDYAQQQSPFLTRPGYRQSYLHFMQFGQAILAKIAAWMGRIPEQELKLEGHEHFQQHYQRGAIIVVSHFGNIELLRAVKSQHIQKINVLVYQKHATKFNQFLQQINPRASINLLCVDSLGVDTAIQLQDKLDQGEWIIIAADRIPIQSQRIQPVSFLNEVAPWPQGAWILAQLLKVPVLAVFCFQREQHLHVHIHKLSEAVSFSRANRQIEMQKLIANYVELLQSYCLRAPYQWFNFYNFWQLAPKQQDEMR